MGHLFLTHRAALVITLLIVTVSPTAGAQGRGTDADREAIMASAVRASLDRFSPSHRRIVELTDTASALDTARARKLALLSRAEVRSRAGFQSCDSSGRCRIAPGMEVVSLEEPVMLNAELATIRVNVRQGTRIARMPTASRSFRYTLERQRGNWQIVRVQTRQQ